MYGDVLRYDWDFGDGESLDDGGPTPSHTYGAQGDYTATVVVTDGDASDGDYTIASIDAANLPPTADAGGPYSGLAGQDILFDGTGSDDAEGPIALYEWDFGDGTAGSGATPSHAYATDGSYTVTLRVTDGGGSADTDTAQVSVAVGNEIPIADAGVGIIGKVGGVFTFNGSNSVDPDGMIVSYDWDFGDGNSALRSPTTIKRRIPIPRRSPSTRPTSCRLRMPAGRIRVPSARRSFSTARPPPMTAPSSSTTGTSVTAILVSTPVLRPATPTRRTAATMCP
jgi:PKD repeat protein